MPEFDLNWPLFLLLVMVKGSAYRFLLFSCLSVEQQGTFSLLTEALNYISNIIALTYLL